MNKKYCLVAVLFSILLVGCKAQTVTVDTIEGKDAKNDSLQIESVKAKAIENSDFIVEYKGVTLEVGQSANSVLKTLGESTANENNNFGFIGWDSENKSKFYSYGYPAQTPVIVVNVKVLVADDAAVLNTIDVTNVGSKRGIKKGGSYESLVDLYGKPMEERQNDNGTIYSYSLGKKNLNFFCNTDKKVESIVIENRE